MIFTDFDLILYLPDVSDIKYFFMYLLAIYVSLIKSVFKSLAHFKTRILFVFVILPAFLFFSIKL